MNLALKNQMRAAEHENALERDGSSPQGLPEEGDTEHAGVRTSVSAWMCPRSHALLWTTAAVGLATDLITKHMAFAELPPSRQIVLIPGILSLDRSLNTGALFGIGKGMSPLFILASVLAVAFVGYMFATSHRRQWVLHLALGMVLAGALGNLYDRLFVKVDVVSRQGQPLCIGTIAQDQPQEGVIQIGQYPDGGGNQMRFGKGVQVDKHSAVRDFIRIDASFRDKNLWPWIFNIADSMLVVGFGFLLIVCWRHPPGRQPVEGAAKTSAVTSTATEMASLAAGHCFRPASEYRGLGRRKLWVRPSPRGPANGLSCLRWQRYCGCQVDLLSRREKYVSDLTTNVLQLPADVQRVLDHAPGVVIADNRNELIQLALGGHGADVFEVAYEVPGFGRIVEANVVRCRNGLAVNYTEAYMRRRDPDCMIVGDDKPTDKPRFQERFGCPFASLREQVLSWLADQHLVLVPFRPGGNLGVDALLIAPANAAFFAAALADLQRMVPLTDLPGTFRPRAIIFLAPPFRHTHCQGRQVVVHNRMNGLHEVFSLNLYPGPSAKKGIYGVLLNIGEDEGWITTHSSTVQVVTPYDNILTIMHEGASGGGKSEMLEYPHREADGRLLLGENTLTGERRYLALPQSCLLRPVTDDMALCHPSLQGSSRKLVVRDAEDAWFIRLNHIGGYGTDPSLERICVHPAEPIIFLNIDAVPQATCLIWEHKEDAPGKPCPNPRVILGRHLVPNVVNDPVEVDVRSFGVRTPPCTRDQPSYGILGLLHFLPPALAWLWRLVAPRGYANPSISDGEDLVSEGVGSYWPFATGRRVVHANLLLRQVVQTPATRYILMPNQHVGAWRTNFMPQWIAREYLARRGGARFRPDQLRAARCPLLGYAISSMHVEGSQIPNWLLETNGQPEIGDDGYDAGAAILNAFFRRELEPYRAESDLDPLGRKIVECCLSGGSLDAYLQFLPIG